MLFQDVSVVSDQGIMKIVIPDEKNGSIVTRTLPIRPATTTREVCKMMAHKLKVTNPQDYGLYKLVDGLGTWKLENKSNFAVLFNRMHDFSSGSLLPDVTNPAALLVLNLHTQTHYCLAGKACSMKLSYVTSLKKYTTQAIPPFFSH